MIAALTIGTALPSGRAVADEGGVSFWTPGTYGSLAAVPGVPGWSFSTYNYYGSVSAGRGVDFVRGGGIEAGVKSRIDYQYVNPGYVFATPVFGGRASLSMGALVGPNTTSAFGAVTGPNGNSISARRSDSVFGVGDLYPTGSLAWNWGVNNVMTYLTGDIPVGLYNSRQLSNLGIGHGAIDGGVGYTYFDQQTGHEFSAVIGATYNLINPSTQYQNGIDGHLDWGGPRNSCPQAFRSASSVMSMTSSLAITDQARSWGRSSYASSVLVRRSAICSRSQACRAM